MSDTTTTGRPIAGFVPTPALSYVGVVCFGIIALAFWFNLFRYGRKFMLTLCISTTTMAIGFAIRIPLTNNPSSMGIYIGYTLFTLLSPCGFIATDYILLPRLAALINAEDCLFLSSRKIVRIFVWSDVITFFLQASGGGMTAIKDNTSMQNIGKWISIIGLVLQCVSFGIFCVLSLVFAARVRSRYPEKWSNVMMTPQGREVGLRKMENWKTVFYTILYTAVGILIRCIFRVIEYAQGYDGYLRTTEWCLYVGDHLPLVLAIIIWIFVWPPRVMERDERFRSGNGYAMTQVVSGGSGRDKTYV